MRGTSLCLIHAAAMLTDRELHFCCLALSGPSQSGGLKKKRVIKLTTKQLKRKKLKRERGEALMDRRSKKVERDSARLDKKLAAKAMW